MNWVSTEEELPDNRSYVLVTIKVPGRFAHVRSSWYQNGLFCNDNGEVWKKDDKEVIGWMYTPDPYDGGE